MTHQWRQRERRDAIATAPTLHRVQRRQRPSFWEPALAGLARLKADPTFWSQNSSLRDGSRAIAVAQVFRPAGVPMFGVPAHGAFERRRMARQDGC